MNMLRIKLPFWRKNRKYPIKRGKYGHSLRRRCFDLFDVKYRPMQIIRQGLVKGSKKTVLRYFEDWKKKRHAFSYRDLRQALRQNPSFRQGTIELLAKALHMSEGDVIARMEKPWGLLSLLKADYAAGVLPDMTAGEKHTAMEEKLMAAISMINFAKCFSHNSPRKLSKVLDAVLNLKDNRTLVIRKEHGKITLARKTG